MKNEIIGILLVSILSVFGAGCLDTTDTSGVNQAIIDTPAAIDVVAVPVEEPVVTLVPPKYAVGDVIGKDIAGIVGCVIVSYSELGDMYAVKIIVNKEGTWMYYNTASETTRMAGRARMEETYPVLLAHISVQDIPMMKQKDAEILSKSTHRSSTGRFHIVGEVENTGIDTLEFVKVIATIYDTGGTVIGTDSTYTQPYTLKCGQVAPFDILCTGDVPQAGKYKVVVDWN